MVQQKRDIIVELTHVGDGQVIATGARERSAEDLLVDPKSPAMKPVVRAPLCVESRNLRLLDGVASRRPGYEAIGTKPNATAVTGLFQSMFDDGTSTLLRFSTATMHTVIGGVYAAITAATPPTGAATDYWDAVMVRAAGVGSPGNQVFAANGVAGDYIYKWTGTGNMARVNTAEAPRGVKTLSFFGNYCFAGNIVDDGADRRNQRIQRSSIIDPTVWDEPNNGAGFVDLREDPFPIAKLSVLAGNQIVLKGDEQGGAIYAGVETGRITEPIEYVALNYKDSAGVGIGILLRRTFLLMNPSLAFFVGHNGAYLWNGQGEPQPVMDMLMKSILRRINYNALDAAFASYFPVTDEVLLHIPTGGSDVANETWVWNRKQNRTYGPWLYADDLITVAIRAESGDLTWLTFDYPGGWPTIPFATWTAISSGSKGRLVPTYGENTGDIESTGDGDIADDASTDIACEYLPPAIGAVGRQARGMGMLSFHDMMTLREVGIRYRSEAAWTPAVAVSVDGGGSYVTVSDGAELAASQGQLVDKSYTASALPGLGASRVFHPRVRNTSGGPLPLHSIRFRFEYGGDARTFTG